MHCASLVMLEAKEHDALVKAVVAHQRNITSIKLTMFKVIEPCEIKGIFGKK